MKMYSVPVGTKGFLIDQRGQIIDVIEWTTRHDLNFTNFVIDPIYYHNTKKFDGEPIVETLAQRGYAVYGGDDGGDANASYLIAIPYNQVRVA